VQVRPPRRATQRRASRRAAEEVCEAPLSSIEHGGEDATLLRGEGKWHPVSTRVQHLEPADPSDWGRVVGQLGDWGRAAEGPSCWAARLPYGRAVPTAADDLRLAAAPRPLLTTYYLLLTTCYDWLPLLALVATGAGDARRGGGGAVDMSARVGELVRRM
jgi:hypothetical protein